MAVTLADAIVYLAADNTQLKKDLAVAKGETQTWTGAVSTMAGNLLSRGIAGAISIATTAAMELGAALKDAVVDSVKLAGSFESQVAELGIAAKASGLSTEELHDAALAVGGDTNLLGVSATGAADAMTTLFKAGLDAGAIFGDLNGYMEGTIPLGGALGASINLAAAAGMDMVDAAELAAISLATYGGEVTTSEEKSNFIALAMDNLVKSADASVAEVDGLGKALTFVGSTAYDAGISFEDTNVALALMSNAGLDAGRAGRNLQSMLGSLQNPTKAAKATMRDLGIEIYNTSDGSMKSLQAIVGELTTGTDGLTQKERDLALGVLFTNAGVRAALPLMNANVKGWWEMEDATAAATGIQEQAAIKAATLAGRLEALEGNVETLKIEIGEKLLPYLTDFVNWMIPFIDEYGPVVVEIFGNLVEQAENLWKAFEPLAEPVTALMEAFTGLMAALGIDTGEGVGWFGKFLGGIVMDKVTEWIYGFTAAIDSLTKILDVSSGVIEWFKGAWDTLGKAQLPPWLTPGSPTPLETALRGLADAAPEAQEALGWLKMENVTRETGKSIVDFLKEDIHSIPDDVREMLNVVAQQMDTSSLLIFEDFSSKIFDTDTAAQASAEWNGAVIEPIKEALVDLGGTIIEDKINSVAQAAGGLLTPIEIATNAILELVQAFLDLQQIDLPSWLIPGSPTPFETGLRGIADAMTNLSNIGPVFAGLGGQTNITEHNYNLTAQYQDRQSPGSLADEVRALSILTAGA